MEKINERMAEVINAAKFLQYFVFYLYYKDLDNPVTYKIYPHEFDTWADLAMQKDLLREQGYSLAKKLYQEQEFKKRQLEMFPLQFTN